MAARINTPIKALCWNPNEYSTTCRSFSAAGQPLEEAMAAKLSTLSLDAGTGELSFMRLVNSINLLSIVDSNIVHVLLRIVHLHTCFDMFCTLQLYDCLENNTVGNILKFSKIPQAARP